MTGVCTVITSTRPQVLGKTFRLESGRLIKETSGQMVAGNFEVCTFESVHDFAALLTRFGPDQALCASVPLNGKVAGRIVTRAELATTPDAIARTKDAFAFPAKQKGVMVLDYDPPANEAAKTKEALWSSVQEAAPALQGCGVVWWASGSSCIRNVQTGDELAGVKGQRLYILVQDLSDTPRAMKALYQRLWLNGHGRIDISSSGALLERGLIDLAMTQTARLDFAPAGSICQPPLEQHRGPPVAINEGVFVDTCVAIPALTTDEAGRFDALVAEAREARRSEACQVRERWKGERVTEGLPSLMRTEGLSGAEAEARLTRCVDSAFAGTLLGDWVLTVVRDDGVHEEVSVSQVLSDHERFNERDCLDPLNPDHRGGAADARLYLLEASPILYSLDDGGVVYRLRRQSTRIDAARGQRHDLVDRLRAEVLTWDDLYMSSGGPVQFESGRCLPLTPARLMLLVGSRCALFQQNKGSTVPTDLQRDVAELLLCALA